MIIDFENTEMEAFKHGFVKGFTSPVMLFGMYEIPELHEVRSVELPDIGDAQALVNDWKAIGADLANAMKNYELKNNWHDKFHQGDKGSQWTNFAKEVKHDESEAA